MYEGEHRKLTSFSGENEENLVILRRENTEILVILNE